MQQVIVNKDGYWDITELTRKIMKGTLKTEKINLLTGNNFNYLFNLDVKLIKEE